MDFPKKENLMADISRSCDFPKRKFLMAYISVSKMVLEGSFSKRKFIFKKYLMDYQKRKF
jgi:hypothetical protein